MSDILPAFLPLTPQARAELAEAVRALENPSLAARVSALVGTPIEALKNRLPNFVRSGLDSAVTRAVHAAWGAAVRSNPRSAPGGISTDWLHRGLAAASGAAGGALGLAGTLTELPFSTTILLRQIAAEATAQGEDPADAGTRAECLKVFALGSEAEANATGPGVDREAGMSDTGYFATRVALTQLLPNAAGNIASAVLPGFLGAIAARFTGTVGLKVSAQAVPVIGAVAGVALNLAFLEHFRTVARAHFTVRRLERAHGEAPVREAYDGLRDVRMAA